MAFNAGLDIELPARRLRRAPGRGGRSAASSRWRRSTRSCGASSPRRSASASSRGPTSTRAPSSCRRRPPSRWPARWRARRWWCSRTTASCRSIPRGASASPLIGPTADDPLALLCGYSFPVHLILNDAGETAAQVVTPAGRVREGVRRRTGRLRPGLLHHRGAQVRLAGVPGRRREEHVARADLAGLAADGSHPRGGGLRPGGGRRGRVRRRPGGPVPDRHRGRGLRRRFARPARACSSSSSRRWSRPGSRWWSCSRAAARTTWAGWRTRSRRS